MKADDWMIFGDEGESPINKTSDLRWIWHSMMMMMMMMMILLQALIKLDSRVANILILFFIKGYLYSLSP